MQRHVLLTGPPGIGKTTLVRKVIDELLNKSLNVNGFYTEEIRDETTKKRTGFQLVTVNGKRATLASVNSKSNFRVGSYGVELDEFEASALPTISTEILAQSTNPTNCKSFIIIDEIGKMELYSSRFKACVDQAFSQENTVILATIPIAKGKPIPFVEKVRNTQNAKLFTVSQNNRHHLISEVIAVLLGSEI